MNVCLRGILSIGLGALILPLQVDAMRIDGIPPMAPVSVHAVVPVAHDGKLQIPLPEGRQLSITPWPAFLPQRFDEQNVTANRQLLPAGPSDRVAFSRGSESQAWLILGSGSRQGTRLLGDWQLQLADSRWQISDGASKKIFASEGKSIRSVGVMLGRECWSIYLLESKTPERQAGLASEQEPQIAWAAMRASDKQRQCPP